MPLIFILLDTEIVVILLALYKKVAEDLMTVYETAADKWLEKSWDGYRIFDNIEHFIDVKVLNDLFVIEYSEMEYPVIYVAEGKYITVLVLVNDIGFDIVSIDDHSCDTLNLLHELKIIVLNMIDLILLLAQNNGLILLVHDRDGHYNVMVSLHRYSHCQVVEDPPVRLEVVVDFHRRVGLDY